MSAFHRGPVALGLAASLLLATSAVAIEASQSAVVDPAAPQVQQAVALVSGGVAAKAAQDPSCPSVVIAEDGAARSADGAKAKLDGLARDCANLGAETIVKVALVGEGERNKKEKTAAAFDAPMTIQVKDAHGRDVETRRINLKVEMAEGVQRVAFRHVEENVSLPPPSAEGYANWTIVVGLDPSAEAEADVAAADEEQVEAPVKAKRSSKRGSRSARNRATRARAVAEAKAAANPGERPVTLSAKTNDAPAAVVMSTTNSGSALNKVAETARARKDQAVFDQQVKQLQADRAKRGLPPVPVSQIRRQGESPAQAAARRQAAGQVAQSGQQQTQTN